MSASYVPYHPEQQQLLLSALQDWLPQGHLAYFINDIAESLSLSAFHARYAAGSPRNQPFHPVMMVEVLVYAYARWCFSSRKIARKLREDVAFRALAADNFPAHRTIRTFRALHLSEFTELFVQVLRLAREMGLSNCAPSPSMAPRSRPTPAVTKPLAMAACKRQRYNSSHRLQHWYKRRPIPMKQKRTNPIWISPGSLDVGKPGLLQLKQPKIGKSLPTRRRAS